METLLNLLTDVEEFVLCLNCLYHNEGRSLPTNDILRIIKDWIKKKKNENKLPKKFVFDAGGYIYYLYEDEMMALNRPSDDYSIYCDRLYLTNNFKNMVTVYTGLRQLNLLKKYDDVFLKGYSRKPFWM